MTDIDLEAIRAREQAATPGPWRWRNTNGEAFLFGARTLVVMAFRRMGRNDAQPQFRDHDTNLLVDAGKANINAFPDAAFIAHARTDIPALIAAVQRRDDALAAVLALCDDREAAGIHWLSVPEVRAAITAHHAPADSPTTEEDR